MENIAKLIKTTAEDDGQELIDKSLRTIRTHLGMEVGYLSEFVGDRAVFRAVDAPGMEALISVGDSQSLEDIYCRHILAGRLPALMPDTSEEPLAASMPITKAVPIGSHMSIPIMRPDGEPYGMFCCLSSRPNKSLNHRDLQTMEIFANLVAEQVNRDIDRKREIAQKRERIEEAMCDKQFSLAYQPIWDFRGTAPAGFESLCRFTGEPYRTPDVWFNEAAEAGLSVDLELAVISEALQAFDRLPDDCYLSVNASPDVIIKGDLLSAFALHPMERIVLEVTEHAKVEDYQVLAEKVAPLQENGMRLAVDDAGAGYASLQHIIQLAPDIIKLDMSLTRDIDTDRARRSLAAALIFFASEMGATIVAEGVETDAEREMLKMLGARMGQGYLLGRPADLDAACGYFERQPARSRSA